MASYSEQMSWHAACTTAHPVKIIAAVLLAACAVAQAQPAPDAGVDDAPRAPPEPPKDPVPTKAEIAAPVGDTAQSVRGKPLPGSESGRLDPVDPGDSTGRLIGRGLLWIPRLPFEILLLPIRGVVYLGERYHAVDTVTEIFTTDSHHLALYPTALFETGFGFNVGVRGFVKDVLGKGEKLKARAAFGGEFLWTTQLGLDTGHLLPGPVTAGAEALYAQRDRERFFGYGNTDSQMPPALPIDPLGPDAGIASRYRIKVRRASAHVTVRLPEDLHVTVTSSLQDKNYGADSPDKTNPDLQDVYQLDQLPGYRAGTRFSYNELEVGWDTRRQADPWDASGMRSTGGLALAYGGYQHALDDGPDFFRVGIDLQRYIRLTARPRTLQFRLWAEAVTGKREEVPFTELPRIGGADLLRGYELDRFRDRVATVAQVSYTWAAASWLAPVLFVDVGRVYSGLDSLSFDHPRVGFGAALEAYNRRGLLVRAQLASSADGGLFAFIALNPAYDAIARVERY